MTGIDPEGLTRVIPKTVQNMTLANQTWSNKNSGTFSARQNNDYKVSEGFGCYNMPQIAKD